MRSQTNLSTARRQRVAALGVPADSCAGLGVAMGKIGLDVEERRSVKTIDVADGEHGAVDLDQIDHGKANRIGALR